MLKQTCYMQQTTTLRTAQRADAHKEWADAKRKKVKAWLNAESKTFSALCGEQFTHKEVLLAQLSIVGLLLACGVAEWLEGGAL